MLPAAVIDAPWPAWVRHAGAQAEHLEGGFEAWIEDKGLLVRTEHVPEPDKQGTHR